VVEQQREPSRGDRRLAVVTGAGSGIGRAVAQRLASDGYHVVAVGRTFESLQATAAAARGFDGRVEPLVADVTDQASVAHVFDDLREVGQRLDLLVNSAGVFGRSALVSDLSLGDWSTVIDTNVTGTFLCCRAAFALMRDQEPRGGRIINLGSVSAQVPRPHSVAYTASKHAVTGITKALALDGREFDIVCSQVDIGNAATDMTAGFQQGVRQASGEMLSEPAFDVAHAADMLAHVAQLPLDANVLFMTLMATRMPLVGRG
jgi:NAD(P)-dependent dehydrogenase (short-subunit alcohol dehydrogenase family)